MSGSEGGFTFANTKLAACPRSETGFTRVRPSPRVEDFPADFPARTDNLGAARCVRNGVTETLRGAYFGACPARTGRQRRKAQVEFLRLPSRHDLVRP